MTSRTAYSRLRRGIYERIGRGALLVGALCSVPLALMLASISSMWRLRVGFFFVDRIGHFIFDAEYYLSRETHKAYPPKSGRDIFFFKGEPSNKQLIQMVRRKIKVSMLVKPLYIANSWLPWTRNQNIVPSRINTGSRDLTGTLSSVGVQLGFTESENHVARAALSEFGLGDADRFICLQIRDSAYLASTRPDTNWGYHSYRDCDIQTYIPAVKELVAQGYWVFRMGKKVEQTFLVGSEKVVDYANHPKRSDFLDIWLMANCHFAISSGTGLDSVSDAFRRPVLYTNYDVFHLMVTWATCLTVPKRLLWRHTGKELSISEYFEYGFAHSERYKEAGIEVVDMRENEITSVVKEMIRWLDGDANWSENQRAAQKRFWREYSSQPKFNQFHGKVSPNSRIGSAYLESSLDQLVRSTP